MVIIRSCEIDVGNCWTSINEYNSKFCPLLCTHMCCISVTLCIYKMPGYWLYEVLFLLKSSKKIMGISKAKHSRSKNSSPTRSACGILKITTFIIITNRSIHIHWHQNLRFHGSTHIHCHENLTEVSTLNAMRTSDLTEVTIFTAMIISQKYPYSLP